MMLAVWVLYCLICLFILVCLLVAWHACLFIRDQNSMADRLANIAMDLDTALYTLLRAETRGLEGLRIILKAARMGKRTVSGMLLDWQHWPELL